MSELKIYLDLKKYIDDLKSVSEKVGSLIINHEESKIDVAAIIDEVNIVRGGLIGTIKYMEVKSNE